MNSSDKKPSGVKIKNSIKLIIPKPEMFQSIINNIIIGQVSQKDSPKKSLIINPEEEKYDKNDITFEEAKSGNKQADDDKAKSIFEQIRSLYDISFLTFSPEKVKEYNTKYNSTSPIKKKDFVSDKKNQITSFIAQLSEIYHDVESLLLCKNKYLAGLGESNMKDFTSCIIKYYANLDTAKTKEQKIQRRVSVFCDTYPTRKLQLLKDPHLIGIGVSGCMSFSTDEGVFFIKPFSGVGDSGQSGINPAEVFLYKVLELLKYGPEVHFSIGGGSTLGSASIKSENFIITKGFELFFDNEEGKEQFDKFKRSNNFDHAIEMSCFSLVKDLLLVGDVFPNNTTNYGITSDNKLMFIDHLPGRNGIFEVMSDEKINSYSPRLNLQEICSSDEYKNKGGNLFNVKDLGGVAFTDKVLSEKVNDRVFVKNNIYNAIDKAKDFVITLINQKSDYFVRNAQTVLEKYIDEINQNIHNYKQTKYAKQGLVCVGVN